MKIIIEITHKDTIWAYSEDSDAIIVKDFLTDPDGWLLLEGTTVQIEREV